MAIEIVDFPIEHGDFPSFFGTVYQRVVGFYGDFSDILCQLIILFSNIRGIISDIFNEMAVVWTVWSCYIIELDDGKILTGKPYI